MTRRIKVPYSLARKRLRASFNKYNVYNAMTWRKNRPLSTQYRQVFFAKQETRAYHGDKLTENQFKNHFKGELPVVSPLSSSKQGKNGEDDNIPYALQSYVGLEKRLDFAVFRAMFASSVRQASVFILRGSVKVNGVRIKSPGYILRPGDVISVNPKRVLYALGRAKPSLENSVKLTNKIITKFNAYIDKCHKNPEKMFKQREKNRKRHLIFNKRYSANKSQRAEKANKIIQLELEEKLKVVKKGLLERVLRGEFKVEKEVEGVVREIRAVASAAGTGAGASASTGATSAPTPSAPAPTDAPTPSAASASAPTPGTDAPIAPDGAQGVNKLLSQLADFESKRLTKEYTARFIKPDGSEPYDPKWIERLPKKLDLIKPDVDPNEVKAVLPFSPTGKLYGLSEPKKMWFTPWTPRPFISPFAILPHHLEIDFETCHAVYLRDPVARPGHSEVISPFSLDMHERSYLWYIYRRRKKLPEQTRV